ncbi:hypothetical protein HB777_07010 [Mesorhizobium loti]|nr:hypothetical protein HB777_07010 [Mesorhizobium loti]
MIVAGGTYGERCIYPNWDRIFGSGLRAAVAASGLSDSVTLHTYVPDEWRDDVEATLSAFGIKGEIKPSSDPITFKYLDSLEKSLIPTPPEKLEPTLDVEGDVVLRFGMMEGEARVKGDRVVYDPQSAGVAFTGNGSSARILAMIIAQGELLRLVAGLRGQHPATAAEIKLRDAIVAVQDSPSPPQIIVVKDGFGGLTVFLGDEPTIIPSYASESYFRIGAGDVIATAFAHAWGELDMEPISAAEYAARSAAYFVEDARLPLIPPALLGMRTLSRDHGQNLRILGFGDYEVRSLVLRTENWIWELQGSIEQVVLDEQDLAFNPRPIDLVIIGSRSTPTKVEEIARLAGTPAVVFWPGGECEQIQHLFPRSIISRDYPSALYHAMRRTVP